MSPLCLTLIIFARSKNQARYCCMPLEQSPGKVAYTPSLELCSLDFKQICVLDEPSNFLDREALDFMQESITEAFDHC